MTVWRMSRRKGKKNRKNGKNERKRKSSGIKLSENDRGSPDREESSEKKKKEQDWKSGALGRRNHSSHGAFLCGGKIQWYGPC